MQPVQIQSPSQIKHPRLPILNMGFRAFFTAAGLYAVIAMAIWFGIYVLHWPLPQKTMGVTHWHAHEMIYGYAIAVIAGFLLTATRNWTNLPTASGAALAGLVMLWLLARVLLVLGATGFAAIFDLTFTLALIVAISVPIIRVRQWRQMGIISKLVALLITNALFYLGALGLMDKGISYGIYGGLYIVIGLIMMMGRRVVPFFIGRGVDNPIDVRNSKPLDLASLALFLVFFVFELARPGHPVAAGCALLLFIVNAARLALWYTPGIWSKPLLWSLYIAMSSISLGFLLHFLAAITNISPMTAIHAFAIGGIGVITLGMMSRVALGHTGRSIHAPPPALKGALASLAVGVLVRVVLCELLPGYYVLWIALTQVLWMLAFAIFLTAYLPMLSRVRADGQPG